MTLRVLVADDHPMYRGGIRAALADVDDIEVVARGRRRRRGCRSAATGWRRTSC